MKEAPFTIKAPICYGCQKHPSEIEEYVEAAKEHDATPDWFVKVIEGTYDRQYNTQFFICTDCYIEMGEPLQHEFYKLYKAKSKEIAV